MLKTDIMKERKWNHERGWGGGGEGRFSSRGRGKLCASESMQEGDSRRMK